MIQIQNITVKNFKNIESADLDLNPINVIIGPNGSGKTNFLMVLAFLKMILRGSNDDAGSLLSNSYDVRLGFTLPRRGKDDVDCFISLSLFNTESGETIVYSLNLSKVKGIYEKTLPGYVKITREQLTFKQKSATGTAITVFSQSVELEGHVSGYETVGAIS
jgi:AAA15 family ATPase/GTPase